MQVVDGLAGGNKSENWEKGDFIWGGECSIERAEVKIGARWIRKEV